MHNRIRKFGRLTIIFVFLSTIIANRISAQVTEASPSTSNLTARAAQKGAVLVEEPSVGKRPPRTTERIVILWYKNPTQENNQLLSSHGLAWQAASHARIRLVEWNVHGEVTDPWNPRLSSADGRFAPFLSGLKQKGQALQTAATSILDDQGNLASPALLLQVAQVTYSGPSGDPGVRGQSTDHGYPG